MPKFLLGKWQKDTIAYWFEYATAGRLVLCDSPNVGVYRSHVDPIFEVEAGSLAEAKVKFNVGAAEFRYVHKGKCLYDAGLTEGDRNAIRRTTEGILGILSNEAIEFLLTVSGVIPSDTPDGRRAQMISRIAGTV